MKLDPKLTLYIYNFPQDIERPELYAAVSQISKPKRFLFTAGKAYLVFALESEKIDYVETFKTAPIELFGQQLKLRDLREVESKPRRFIVPISFKQLKSQEVYKKLKQMYPYLKNPKITKERGYSNKYVVESSFSCLVYALDKKDFLDVFQPIQVAFPGARDYDGESSKIVISGLKQNAGINDIVSAMRAIFKFPTKLIAFANYYRCYLQFYSYEDKDLVLYKGKFVVNGAECTARTVTDGHSQYQDDQDAELYEERQDEEEHEESSYSFEGGSVSDAISGKNSEENYTCSQSKIVSGYTDYEPEAQIQIYDPNRPLSEYLEETFEQEEESNSQSADFDTRTLDRYDQPEREQKQSRSSGSVVCPEIFISGLPLYLPASFTNDRTVKQTLRFYLIKLFKSFGTVAKCIINERADNLAGTAFVEFQSQEAVEKVFDFLQFLERNKSHSSGEMSKEELQRIYEFVKQSRIKHFLVYHYIDGASGRFKLNGHAFSVYRALSRSYISDRKDNQKKESQNEQLFKYGAKISGSGLEMDVPGPDLAKRDALYKELKFKASNPNYKFSDTRLVVKNLVNGMDEMEVMSAFWRYISGIVRSKVQTTFEQPRLQGLIEKYKIQATDWKTSRITNNSFSFMLALLKISEFRIPRKGRAAVNLARCEGDVIGRLQQIEKTGYFGYELQQMCVIEFKTPDAARYFFDLFDNQESVFGKIRRPIVSYAAEKTGYLRQPYQHRTEKEERPRKQRNTRWAQEHQKKEDDM